jgi:aquaporin Z
MRARLRRHWPEYVMEAAGLGLFLIAAAAFATVIHHPASPLRQTIVDPILRRALMGGAMGLTAIALIYSPIGARSGAHLNPATTLMFYRLGRIDAADAVAYGAAHFAGALAGIAIAAALLGPWIASADVNYVATRPGTWGDGVAFVAEAVMTFLLMSMVLRVSNHPRWSRRTGLAVGLVIALYITVADPLSGMSLNPARSFGPALFAGTTSSLWIYFTAPPLGMLLAAEVYTRRAGRRVFCAKLNHHGRGRCIFLCRFDEMPPSPASIPIGSDRTAPARSS